MLRMMKEQLNGVNRPPAWTMVGQHNAKLGPGDAKTLLAQTCRMSVRRRRGTPELL